MSAETTYKGFSSFFKQCVDSIVSVLKVIVKSKIGNKLPIADSTSCIVLGNGPSLKTSLTKHPAFFTKHPLVCVNSFSITDEYTLLKPTYYVILDPGYWYGEAEVVTNTVSSLINKTTWTVHLLVPPAAKHSARFREIEKQNSNIKISYFNYTVYKGLKGIGHWLFKKNLAMPQSQNVLVASLFLSVNIGFKEIYVFGADHSWHQDLIVTDNNIVCFKDAHFYGDEKEAKHQPLKKGLHLNETFKMYEVLNALAKAFYGYEVVDIYAENSGATIYNASEISFIDAFKRIKL